MRKASVFVAAIVSLFALFFNDAAYAVDAVPTPEPTPSVGASDTPTPSPTEPSPTPTTSQKTDLTTEVPSPVIVQVRGSNLTALRTWIRAEGIPLEYTYTKAITGVAVSMTPSQIAKMRAALPGVIVTPDKLITLDTTQTNAIWNLSTLDQTGAAPDANYVYPNSAGSGVKVYVLDTGVNANPELGTRLLPGADFTGSGTTADCNGHGTHVAGTIASTTYGVAKKAYIVPVHVLSPSTTCANTGSTADVIRGIEWAIADNPDGVRAVINMSLGAAGGSAAMTTAVNNAVADGIVVAVAAGNSTFNACYYTPAGISSAITVGAIDRNNVEANFSNYGNCVDIYAPGVGIKSLDYSNTSGTRTIDGTSMATPHVAGAAALYIADHPSATATAVSDAIIAAGEAGVTRSTTSSTAGSPNLMLDIAAFGKSPIAVTTPPSVSVQGGSPAGKPRVGGTVSVTRGVWAPTTGLTKAYQWYACSAESAASESVLPPGCVDIALATTEQISVTPDLLGVHLLVAETASTNTQSSTVFSASKGVVQQAPQNTAAPALSGSSGVGGTLSVSDGSWTASPGASFTYQWHACSVASDSGAQKPSSCTPISGATTAYFTPTSSQLGKFLVAEVKALNAAVASPVSHFSASSDAVTQKPINISAPVVTTTSAPGPNGTARYIASGTSSTITVSDGTWTGTGNQQLTYRWFRCDTAHTAVNDFVDLPGDCQYIGSEGSSSRVITSDDVQHYLGAVVSSTNSIGDSQAASATTAQVNAVPVNTVDPTVASDAFVGEVVSSTRGTWDGTPAPTFTYQWFSCTASHDSALDLKPADCSAITSATSATYTPDATLKGKYLVLAVKASNAAVASPVTRYTASTAVVRQAPVVTVAPVITVTTNTTADVNKAPTYRPEPTSVPSTGLTASTGTWTATPAPTYSYEWFRCSGNIAASNTLDPSCESMQLTNPTSSMTVGSDDVGYSVVVGVTATNSARAVTTYSKSTLLVSQAPRSVNIPDVAGTPTEGNALSLAGAVWDGSATLSFSYQWYACASAVASGSSNAPSSSAGCVAITNATLSTFVPRSSERDKFVLARVGASNSAVSSPVFVYTASTTTDITPAPMVSLTKPGADGAPIFTGNSTTNSVLTALAANTATPAAQLTYQWYRCDTAHEANATLDPDCTAITNQTGKTYSVTSADVGEWILALVNDATDTHSVTYTGTTAAAVGAPPVNTVAPSISGLPAIAAQTLTAVTGTWTGSPAISYTYQWYSCTAATLASPTVSTSCTALSGATRSTFVVPETLKDLFITVRIVAVNAASGAAGAVTRVAPSSGKVLTIPTNSIAPRVTSTITATSGAPVAGATLSAVAGVWKGSAPLTFSYQWYVCDSNVDTTYAELPADCVAADGATLKTFSIGSAQVGKYVTVVESVSNAAATRTKWATASLTVAAKPTRSSDPTISGVVARDEELTATPFAATANPEPDYSYSWLRCTSAQVAADLKPAACSTITNATASTYTLQAADVGKYVSVMVTATNTAGSVSRMSASTTVVADPVGLTSLSAPRAVTPAADGSASVGSDLTTDGGVWTGTPAPTKTYQWYSCTVAHASTASTVPDDCSVIDGSTTNRFTTTSAEAGSFIAVAVTATNSISDATVLSPTTATAVVDLPHEVDPVTLSSEHEVGQTITLTAGTWTANPDVDLSYRWYRCSSAVSAEAVTAPNGCVAIDPAQTALTYRLIAADVGKYIVVAETATNRGGDETTFSVSSELVISPPVFTGTILVTGNPWVGRTVSLTGDNFSGTPVPTKTYRWFTCDSQHPDGLTELPSDCGVIDGAVDPTLPVVSDYDAKYLMAEVTAANDSGQAVVLSGAIALVKRTPTNVSAPAVNGDAVLGATVTADVGTWDGTDPITYDYQWFRCTTARQSASDTVPTGCTAISGQTARTFVITSPDVEKYLVVRVTAKNSTEDKNKFSPTTEIVSTMPAYSKGLTLTVTSPSTKGSPRSGYEVRATAGVWTARPSATLTYAWYTCPSAVAAVATTISPACTLVDGASTATLSLTRDMVGRFPVVKVTATNLAGSDSRYSASTTRAVITPPQATTVQSVAGHPYVQGSVTTTLGVWNASPTSTQTLSWWLCTSQVVEPQTSTPVGCTVIANQTKTTLPVLAAYRGKFLSSMVTAVNEAGTTKQWSESTTAVVDGPVNKIAPTLSSSPANIVRAGGSLLVTDGTWVGDPTPTIEVGDYAWYACDNPVNAAGSELPDGCSVIFGEGYNELVLTNDLVQKFIVSSVTAHNIHGDNIIYSKSSIAVASSPFNEQPPIISDNDFVARPITSTPGSWSGWPDPVYSNQWMRCINQHSTSTSVAADVADCSVIAGATEDSYTPVIEDIGYYVLLRETASNRADTVSVWSSSSDVIRSGPVIRVAPTITVTNGATNGAPLVGGSVSTAGGTWAGVPTPTKAYQWMRCATQITSASANAPGDFAHCTDIDQATSSSYDPVAEDAGKYLMVRIDAHNENGDATHYSAGTIAVRMAPVMVTPPAVRGAVFVLGTARAKEDTWNAFPAVTRSYQWLLCSSPVVDDSATAPVGCSPTLDGAKVTYVIPASQNAQYLVVGVTVSNGEGSPVTRYSATSAQIVEGPVNVANPVISGTARLGASELSVSTGDWVPAANRPTLTYQWYRCDVVTEATDELDPAANCVELTGETMTYHAITEDDPGKSLVVGVTGTNDLGSSTRYTASTPLVTELLRVVTDPSITGAPQAGTTTGAAQGVWRGFPRPTATHDWFRCPASVRASIANPSSTIPSTCKRISQVNDVTNPRYAINRTTDVGSYLVFKVAMTNGADAPVTRYSAGIGPVAEIPWFKDGQPVLSFVNTQKNTDDHPLIGDQLKVSATITTVTASTITKSYQWYRCDAQMGTGTEATPEPVIPDGSGCVAIDGATASTYTVASADMAKFITVAAAGTNSAGTMQWMSPMSEQVQKIPVVLENPTVTGDRLAGAELTATAGTWSSFPEATPTYQWYRCPNVIASALSTIPASCVELIGNTSETYTQSESDKGKYVTVVVTGHNSAGQTDFVVPVQAADATASAPANTASPSVENPDGINEVGQTFLASGDRWSGLPAPTVVYQWFSCTSRVMTASNDLDSSCSIIDGATGPEYFAVVADSGHFLLVRATATNPADSAVRYSASTSEIETGHSNVSPPEVSLDHTLLPATATAVPSQWSPASATVTGLWLACSQPITQTTSIVPDTCEPTEYTDTVLEMAPGFAYAGMYLAYGESATWPTDSRVIVSTTTQRIEEAPSLWSNLGPKYVAPSVGLTATVGTEVSLTTGAWSKTFPVPSVPTTWRGSPTGTVGYQWMICTSPHLLSTDEAAVADCTEIAGATNAKYTPVHDDVEKYLLVRLTATNTVGSSSVWTASTIQVTQKPLNTVAPSISWGAAANPILGGALTATTGEWEAFPALNSSSYARKWYSCTSVTAASNTLPAGCTLIASATASTYVLPSGPSTMAGKYVVVEVTATNDGGSSKKYSASTTAVYEAPVNTKVPTINPTSGNVGQTLTATTATADWRATPSVTSSGLSFQWFACENPVSTSSSLEGVATGCTALEGQTASVHSLTADETRKYVVVRVGATNAAGTSYKSSVATIPVKDKPRNLTVPTVSGDDETVTVGQTLTSTDGTWDGFPTPTFTRQWYVCTSSLNPAPAVDPACKAITGQTSTSLPLTSDLTGKFVLLAVTAKSTLNNNVNPTIVQTSQTRGRIRQAPINSVAPTISGTAHLGETLNASVGTWTGYPTPTTSYSWFSCTVAAAPTAPVTTAPDGCVIIDGADDAPLTLRSAHVGKRIIVVVTATNAVGESTKTSKSTLTVSSPPSVTTAPLISGNDFVNTTNKATVSTGTWSGSPTPTTFAYQWYRCPSSSVAGSALADGCVLLTGKTANAILLTSDMSGKYLVARVTATAAVNKTGNGSTATYSASFGPIRTAPVNTVAPTISGTAAVGNILRANTGTWTGSPTPTLNYQWYDCGTKILTPAAATPAGCQPISGSENQDLYVDSSLQGHRLIVRVVATNGTSPVVKTSATTAAVAPAVNVLSVRWLRLK